MQALPYLADRLIVLPQQKLIMCSIEKNAITLMSSVTHGPGPRRGPAPSGRLRASPGAVVVCCGLVRALHVPLHRLGLQAGP